MGSQPLIQMNMFPKIRQANTALADTTHLLDGPTRLLGRGNVQGRKMQVILLDTRHDLRVDNE